MVALVDAKAMKEFVRTLFSQIGVEQVIEDGIH
jgi:hypothetical protein